MVAAQVLLAAADKQLVTLTRAIADGEAGTAVLRVRLPLCAAPLSRAEWAWHVLVFTVPPHVPAHATWCAPTLRVAAHRLRVDLPFTVSVPTASAVGHRVGLGLDWGVNTLLTGTVARLTDHQGTPGSGCTGGPGTGHAGGRVVSDGRRLRYDASAISAKLHRLRTHRERLAAKRDRYAALLSGLCVPDLQWADLHHRHAAPWSSMSGLCADPQPQSCLAWSAAAGRWIRRSPPAPASSTWKTWPRWRRVGAAGAMPVVGAGARSGGGGDPAPGGQGRDRGGDRPARGTSKYCRAAAPAPGSLLVFPPSSTVLRTSLHSARSSRARSIPGVRRSQGVCPGPALLPRDLRRTGDLHRTRRAGHLRRA